MDYKIVSWNDSTSVERDVQRLIARGWTPLGGVSTAGEGMARNYSQAMVRQPLNPEA